MRQFLSWLFVIFAFSLSPILAQPETTFTGTLNDEKTFYEYPILVAEDNTTIIADSQATSGDLDTIIYLLDETGNILAQNDNRTRDVLDAYLEYPYVKAGAYTVILARYDLEDGTTSGDFSFAIRLTPTISELPVYDLSSEALASVGYPLLEPKPQAEWTVLAYYGGDSDLEESLITDLKEFELAGGGDDTIRIIAFVDRSPEYSTVSDDWSGAKIYEVTANIAGDEATKTINSQVVASFDAIDSGDGLTLAQFIMWGIRVYPANHYALAFGGHGAGWAGVIPDYTAGSIISLSELDHVFKSITTSSIAPLGFDVVINDACLMSSAEYHGVMSRYFKLSFASPEVVVDPALDMTLFTNDLRENPQIDNIPTIGSALVDKYITIDVLARPGSDNTYMTNAVTDLTKFADLEVAINTFADVVISDPLRFSPIIGEARSNAYTYTAFRNGASLIDLGNFMRQVILLSTDESLISSAEAVLIALQSARIYGNGGERVNNRVLYQNIYFPEKAKNFDNAYFINSPLTRWGEMLRAYYNALSPKQWKQADIFHPPTPPQVSITSQYPQVPSIVNPLRMEMEIVGRNVARGLFIVDYRTETGDYERLIESLILSEGLDELGNVAYTNEWGSGVYQTTFEWNLTLTQLTDGTTSRFILTHDADDTLSIEGRYRSNESAEWVDIIVIFGENPNDPERGIMTRVVSRDPNSDALGVVNIPANAQFQPYKTVVSEDGQTQVVPDETITFSWDTLEMIWYVPAPSGEYNLGFVIEAFGGSQSTTTQTVTVNNDGLAPNLRGFTDIVWGYNFVLTTDWYEPVTYPDLGYEEAYYSDELTRLRVYQYEQEDETAEVSPELILSKYGFNQVSEETETITVNGEEKIVYAYTDGFVVGVGTLYETPDGYYLWVGMEYPEDTDIDRLLDMLTNILNNFTLFDIRDIFSTKLWGNGLIGTLTGNAFGATYAIPETWNGTIREDGIWVVASPQDNPNIFMRLTQVTAYDAAVLRDAIITDYIQPDTQDFTITEKRVYYGQANTWQVALYTAKRNDTEIIGRVYATIGAFDNAVVIWQEAPTENAPTLFREVFEPIVDALSINKPFRSYPLTEYGFVLNYPLNWGYMGLVEDDGYPYLTARSGDGFSIYVIEMIDDTANLDDLLTTWTEERGYEVMSDATPVTYNNKEGLLIEIYATDEYDISYNGYAFITTSADGTKGIVFYIVWVDTEPSPEIFDLHMTIHDYGIEPDLPVDIANFTYQRGWIGTNLPQLGISLLYPDTWGNITFNDTFGTDRYAVVSSPTGSTVMSFFYEPDGEIEQFIDDLYNYEGITITPLDALRLGNIINLNRYEIVIEGDDYTAIGRVLALPHPDGGVFVVEIIDYDNNLNNITSLLDGFIDGLGVYTPEGVSFPEEPTDIGETTDYTFDELGVIIPLPSNWDEPVYQEGLIYSLSDDQIFGLYIYYLDTILPLSDMADVVGEFYELEYDDEFAEFDLDGREILEVSFTYDDGGFAGIAFVTVIGERTVMFSVEGLSETDLSVYYDLLVNNIVFLDE